MQEIDKEKYPGIWAMNEATKNPLIARIIMDSIKAVEVGIPSKNKNPLRDPLPGSEQTPEITKEEVIARAVAAVKESKDRKS